MNALLTTLLFAVTPAAGAADTSSYANPTLTHCLVSVKDEVNVPAQEPGLLISLVAIEGLQVRRGDLLGRIDDSERLIQKRLALIEQATAKEEAENDINVRYARAASAVSQAEYDQALEANRKVRGTVPEAEVRRLKLAWGRAELQIEQSQVEQRIAGFTVHTRAAEVEAADNNIRRRQVKAPIDGEVVSVSKHEGEWVTPGEVVLRIVRFDTLRVEGFVNSTQYDPSDVADRPVTVEVELARGRRMTMPGKIVYVSNLVQPGGDYRVWAEVTNRQEGGEWALRPGLDASMTIHMQ